jgi:hypothetical protein
MTDEIKLQRCSTCKSTQVQDQYFSINRRGVYNKTCDKCLEWNRLYREANRERRKEYHKANQEKFKQYNRQYREANKDEIKQRMDQYNKQYKEDKRHHCEHNTQKIRCKICDPQGHLRGIVSSRIHNALKSDKTDHSIEYLGCTIAEFKAHIESLFKENMNWENFGDWHIDHIVPIKYKKNGQNPTIEDVIERLHWKNTQPMWAEDNIAKGNRFIG